MGDTPHVAAQVAACAGQKSGQVGYACQFFTVLVSACLWGDSDEEDERGLTGHLWHLVKILTLFECIWFMKVRTQQTIWDMRRPWMYLRRSSTTKRRIWKAQKTMNQELDHEPWTTGGLKGRPPVLGDQGVYQTKSLQTCSAQHQSVRRGA